MLLVISTRLAPLMLSLILALAAVAPGFAQATASDRTGDWLGVLEVPGGSLRLLISVQSTSDGFTGQLESLDQAPGQKMPLDSISIGDTLTFEFSMAAVSYTGQWDEARQVYAGTFTQGGSMPLEFARPEAEQVEAHHRPQEPVAPFPYAVEDVRFENARADDVTLAGTLTLPAGEGPFPAAILVSGSGPQDRDQNVFTHRTFAVLADHLTRRGIAVLRYDDRGFGESTGDFGLATSADFATDTEAAFAYLRARSEIKADAIGIIGHSEGGLIAPLVARSTPELGFAVMLAGPGVDTQTLMLDQTRTLARFQGIDQDQYERSVSVQRQMMAIAASDMDDDTAATELRDVLTDEIMAEIGENPELRDRIIATTLRPWNRWFLRHDPAPWLESMTTPLLAIGGTLDVQVSSQMNLPAIEAATLNHPDVTVTMLEGLNHMFQTAETGSMQEYAQIEETFDPEAMRLVSDWINARFGG